MLLELVFIYLRKHECFKENIEVLLINNEEAGLEANVDKLGECSRIVSRMWNTMVANRIFEHVAKNTNKSKLHARKHLGRTKLGKCLELSSFPVCYLKTLTLKYPDL